MFKSRRKRQQQKLAEEAAAANKLNVVEISKYKLLDDIQVAHDFRSSVILPQLNKDLDAKKMSGQQQHLLKLREIPESPLSPPLSPPPSSDSSDGTKQYQELAAWRHQRSQNRYSNGLFGGKQRGRPKPNQIKKIIKNENGEIEEIILQEKDEETITDKPSIISMLHNDLDFSDDESLHQELLQEQYEPDSDTEENYFFQDFSADNKKQAKKTAGRRRGSVMTKFDLSSFARDLHDHRLSVIQPRDSRIIMTEDDELELEKLLERQRQRMSMMPVNESSESLAPPLPSLDLIKSHQVPIQMPTLDHSSTTSSDTSLTMKNSFVQKDEDVTQTITNTAPITPVYTPPVHTAPVYTPPLYTPPVHTAPTHNLPPVHTPHVYTPPVNTESMHTEPMHTEPMHTEPMHTEPMHALPPVLTPHVYNPPVHAPPTHATLPVHNNIRPLASVSASTSMSVPKIDQIKRSISTTSIKSNTTMRTRTKLAPIRDEIKQTARKSLSMDNIHIKLDENEPSVTSAALDWICQDSSQDPTSFLYKKTTPAQIIPPKSRSLFGSLRQVSRSKTHAGNGVTSIKGLVRNFSSSHKPDRDSGMSRAAMAVIQHNSAKKTEEEPKQRTKSDANLISHLISRAASSSKKFNATKIVNMEDATKKRAQVVRRTIIYVQPDSLHDMLKNNVPPLPSTRNTMISDGSLSPDDDTIRSKEYATATKIVRQTSVRKRVVEDTTVDSNQQPLPESIGFLSRQASKRRYQLKSVDENDLLKDDKHGSSSSSGTENSDYLEGVELREMSDGTVVWGLVKKQGNRKSFYAPNQQDEYEHIEDEEEDTRKPYQHGLPPPIPKRSPRRQETDVYYSDQVTLPSLLKMMHEQHPGDDDAYVFNQRAMTSVDDQLDEMMRILTSQQQ